MTREEVEQMIEARIREERIRIARYVREAMPSSSYFSESECAARAEVREFAEYLARAIESE